MDDPVKDSYDLESIGGDSSTVVSQPLPRHAHSYSRTRTEGHIHLPPGVGIDLHRPPTRGAPNTTSRVPIEFRTLSIQIEETRQSEARTGEKETRELLDLDWHILPAEDVLQRLSTSQQVGLDQSQAARRLQQHGKNVISPPPSNLLLKIIGYFFGGFGSLLFVASIICFLAWKPLGFPDPQASNLALAVVLLIVVLIQAAFNAWQDFSTSRTMASITNMLPADVSIIRDGQQRTIPAPQLVPGDIVNISLGQKLPADMRLLDVSGDLRFDRAVLTGESIPVAATVEKTDENFLETKNIALQGTLCVAGSGLGVVIQTGDLTVFGRIAKLSNKSATHMPTLVIEILRFVLLIASMAIGVAVIIVILWGAWLHKAQPNFINVPTLLIDVVSVCVAFIPEGLPVCVTLSLARTAQVLSQNKILCKTLSTVETLGAVNVICSDKTGTLTENRMTVEHCYTLDDEFTTPEARDKIVKGGIPGEVVRVLQTIGAMCNAAKFVADEKTVTGHGKIAGDATDTAILQFAESLSSAEDIRAQYTEIYRQSFSSKTKYMLKLVSETASKGNSECTMFIKGAPDVLWERCGHCFASTTGNSVPLDRESMAKLVAVQEHWASQGQRVLLLARKKISLELLPKDAAKGTPLYDQVIGDLAYDLEIVGLLGIVDPPRADIPETVRVCRSAGIRFFIVTGDHPNTAVTIAAKCGIVTHPEKIHHFSDLDPTMDTTDIAHFTFDNENREVNAVVLDGSDLTKMTTAQWDQVCQYEEIVFARTSPEQKLRIVTEMQSHGNIVGMTGDGVNDAPSLKAANMGIAMGSGSDVAMEASDMVLLGPFSTIVVAIQYGRLVFDNLKKTVLYLLPAGSFSELMPVIFNVLFGLPQILSNLQMIIICVGTDVLPALSLVMEKPEADLLLRRPRIPKKDRLANWRLIIHAYFFLGILESLCAMALAYWFLQRKGIPFSAMWLTYGNLPPDIDPDNFNELLNQAQSVYFFTLVIMQWGNLLSTRTRRLSIFQHPPIFNRATQNLYLFGAMACALGIAVFFSYIPFFQNVFLTRGVPVEHYFLPLAFGIGILLIDECRKYGVRKWPKGILAWVAW
ncbi:sodium-potassium ATPase [Dacryopinax primogenitus]|uniref:Sodium-potassium ATPase n=1 Tax=Dacryopinax primogenitus (strain DJM 731) TaxID=1858805 RepID=M5G0U0_DACPD|nr:sodium-potassium ATPase [Dacryopinax primogenitus]EJT99446.1 sodium-potassium ATPase [Dacryopinax primogenitus]